MPIPVFCSGCKSRFTVSDKFAGRTGPCPKCKQPITIPTPAVREVTIHDPTGEAAAAKGPGRITTVPLPSLEQPVPPERIAFVGVAAACLLVVAVVVGWIFPPPAGPPVWLLGTAAIAIAYPAVLVGYEAFRDRGLEPHSGRELLLRALACAAVYAGLWAAKGMLPPDLTRDFWQWIYIGPPFLFAGSLAALAALELDWGQAVTHYSFYVLYTAVLRWLAGLSPL